VKKHMPADIAAVKFWLWNRTKTKSKEEQWSDKQELDLTSGNKPFAAVVILPPKKDVT